VKSIDLATESMARRLISVSVCLVNSVVVVDVVVVVVVVVVDG
jgi:hypothetical protein